MSYLHRSITIAEPSSEPLTLSEAKNQVELAEADTSRDTELTQRIVDAREQVERDSNQLLIQRTVTVKYTFWPACDYLILPWGPVSSITSIAYRDSSNNSQTVSTGDYSLDGPNWRIVFDSDYVFPTLFDRWDAVTVTYVGGYGDTPAEVPGIFKQMMRLLIAYGFDERNQLRNELITGNQKAYNSLLNRVMRATYP